jgi:16S rRNA (cytidine1402-2'-O)-methyltransferase
MLYLVPTPIGNLSDITLRALEVLKSVDVIACEDTRHSGHLLRHFEIHKPLVSYHEHNEARRTAELIEELAGGKSIAVITDAGMPGVSDPGHRLLAACRERGLPCTVLPGPSAVLTALIGSGFSAESFYFGGFLPPKSGGRERDLRAAAARSETSIFFESPHRLVKTLAVCAEHLPTRQLCVARELTKTFEEYRRGTGAELLAHYTAHPPKGEIVLLIDALDRRERREAERAE